MKVGGPAWSVPGEARPHHDHAGRPVGRGGRGGRHRVPGGAGPVPGGRGDIRWEEMEDSSVQAGQTQDWSKSHQDTFQHFHRLNIKQCPDLHLQ